MKKIGLLLLVIAGQASFAFGAAEPYMEAEEKAGKQYERLMRTIKMYNQADGARFAKQFLATGQFDETLNIINAQGDSFFDIAVLENNPQVLEVLAQAPQANIELVNNALYTAAGHNHPRCIAALRSVYGIDPNKPSLSIQRKYGQDIRQRTNEAFTPLLLACLHNNVGAVHELLQFRNIDVNVQGDGNNTPLHIAAQHGFKEVAKELLSHPAIKRSMVNIKGQTPAMLATLKGHGEIARLINYYGQQPKY